jgi:hypothetical protein
VTPAPDVSRDDLLLLVRWLALPYGANTPVFAMENPYGQPLPASRRLKATWEAIIGEGNETPGVWRQCAECRGWYVAAPGSDRRLNDADIEAVAKLLKAPA